MLRAADGSVVATNYLDFAVHPRDFQTSDITAIWSPRPYLRARFEALSYQVTADSQAATLRVTNSLDHTVAAHVQEGGRLLLPTGEFRLNPLFPHWQNVRVRKRAGTAWRLGIEF